MGWAFWALLSLPRSLGVGTCVTLALGRGGSRPPGSTVPGSSLAHLALSPWAELREQRPGELEPQRDVAWIDHGPRSQGLLFPNPGSATHLLRDLGRDPSALRASVSPAVQ